MNFENTNFISEPVLSNSSSISKNVLEFDYSFGYDCKRYFNLTMADDKTLIFVSGNLMHFFDVASKEIRFRRSALGNGIGYITKNPNPQYQHVAVGENGPQPLIIIYQWPLLNVVCLLRDGAASCFTHLAYNSDGTLLASHSGKPDYLITIYDWQTSTILLRGTSNAEAYRLIFSADVPGQLISCGSDHIKFWKIVKTFTGLKLQGELGRFVETENCNILGILPMPDEKVISGCDWGNILVWDKGTIKMEVGRRLNRKCHDAPITQFYYLNGKLWSFGMDGKIKIWYYKTIDEANPPDDYRFVFLEPIYEFDIPEVSFMYVCKGNDNLTDALHFAQDGNGGLWRIDLNIDNDPQPPIQLFKCHAGAIVDIAVCEWGPYVVSLGIDGRLHLYNYIKRKLLLACQYSAKGSAMIWLSSQVQKSGNELILGFDDGNLRIVVLSIDETLDGKFAATTIQVTKPHRRTITKITINDHGTLLVTGSEDATVFVYKINREDGCYCVLVPIGYVELTATITSLTCQIKSETTVLAGCIDGHFVRLQVPMEPQPDTSTTYILKGAIKQQNLITHTTQASRLLWIQCADEKGTIWISTNGFIYQYKIDQDDVEIIYDGGGVEISDYASNHDNKYLVFAMGDGSIRVTKIDPNERLDFSDHWRLSMHDNLNGFIPRIRFGYDENYFFSCGHDGNLFSYKFNPQTREGPKPPATPVPVTKVAIKVDDVDGYAKLSLEEMKIKTETDEVDKSAKKRKEFVFEKLKTLRRRFEEVREMNGRLMPTQIIPSEDLEIDRRITADLDETYAKELDKVKHELGFQVEKSRIRMEKIRNHFLEPLDVFPISVRGFDIDVAVNTFRQRKLTEEFFETLNNVEQRIAESESTAHWEESIVSNSSTTSEESDGVEEKRSPTTNFKEDPIERFLLGLSFATIEKKFGGKLNRLLIKYRLRRSRYQKRHEDWGAFKMLKPTENVERHDHQSALNCTKENVGDFKLKMSHDYQVPKHLWTSTLKKYRELLLARLRQFNLRYNYNVKVYKLKEERVKVLNLLNEYDRELNDVRQEINPEQWKTKPNIPIINVEEDFPEENLKVVVQASVDVEQDRDRVFRIIEAPKEDLLEKEVLVSHASAEIQEVETAWELEAKSYRQSRKLFEQDLILNKMEKAIRKFDDQLQTLYEENICVSRDGDFLDLHLLTLYRELIVLKEFDNEERRLQEDIRVKVANMLELQDAIEVVKTKIDDRKTKIFRLQHEKADAKKQFLSATSSCEFFDALNKVFTIPADCEVDRPVNCDPLLYDLVLDLRSKMHHVKLEITNTETDVNVLKTNLEVHFEKLKGIKDSLKVDHEKLSSFQNEKQRRLNEVQCTIVLKLHQLQHFDSENRPSKIANALVFSQSALTELYKRVGQLHSQTLLQKAKHKTSLVHLRRLNTDCEHMKKTIAALNEKILETMKIKFGQIVDIDEIEEMQLKRMLFNLRLSQNDIKCLYEQELHLWNEKFKKKQPELIKITKENTSRLELLKTLNSQRFKLIKSIFCQDRRRENLKTINDTSEIAKREIDKLLEIIEKQNHDIQVLRDKIRVLSFKCNPTAMMEQKTSNDAFHLDEDAENLLEWKDWSYNIAQEPLPTLFSEDEAVDYNDEEEEDEPILRMITKEVQIPSVLSDDAEDTAKILVSDMLNLLGSYGYMSKNTLDILIEQILHSLLRANDVDEITDNLVAFLPEDLVPEQLRVVQATARQLWTLQESKDEREDSQNI